MISEQTVCETGDLESGLCFSLVHVNSDLMCLLLYGGAPTESLPPAIEIKETEAKAKKLKAKDIRAVLQTTSGIGHEKRDKK